MAHDFPSMFRGLSLDELEKCPNWSATTRARLLDVLRSMRQEMDELRQARGVPASANDLRASLEDLISAAQSSLAELDAKREVVCRERDRLKAALAALDGPSEQIEDSTATSAAAPALDHESSVSKEPPGPVPQRRAPRKSSNGRITARQAVHSALSQADGPLARKQIIAATDCVTPHAVDVALSTMVRQGELVRVKPGHYELPTAREAA